MKLLTFLVGTALSLSTFAAISLDIDLKNEQDNKRTHFHTKMQVNLGELSTVALDDTNQVIEIVATDNTPRMIKNNPEMEKEIMIDIKIIETINGKRNILASPKVITIMGQEATMEKYDDKDLKNATTTLIIKPTQIQ